METNGTNGQGGGASAQDKVLRVDLTALRPTPKRVVVWGKPPVEYPILEAADLLYDDFVTILEAALKAKESAGSATEHRSNMVEIRRQLKLLCPTLTDEVLAKMTYRETIAFLNSASEIARDEAPPENPPTPAPSESPAASLTS